MTYNRRVDDKQENLIIWKIWRFLPGIFCGVSETYHDLICQKLYCFHETKTDFIFQFIFTKMLYFDIYFLVFITVINDLCMASPILKYLDFLVLEVYAKCEIEQNNYKYIYDIYIIYISK